MPSIAPKPNRLIDIAKIAGVSRTTVAKVLLDTGGRHVRIGEKTSEKIKQIAAQLNYQPNIAARRLKGKSSQLIGVIIDSCAPLVSFSRLSKMEFEAARRGYRFMVGQSHDKIEHISAYAKDFCAYGVDGVICISHDYPEMGEQIAQMFSNFKNVVFVDKPTMAGEKLCFVQIDYEDGVRLLIEYLMSKSHQNIATVLTNLKYPPVRAQWDGYIKVFKNHRLRVQEDLMVSLNEIDPPQELINAVTAKLCEKGADAILALNDEWAIKIVKALKKLGKRVPEDVAVVGFGNSEFATIYEPGITTVDEDLPELSRIVVEMLIEMIEGTQIVESKRQIYLKPKLVVRDSA